MPADDPYAPPEPPHNALHTLSETIGTVLSLPSKPVEMLNEGFAKATNFIAQALPSFPAATLGSLAVGMPHAHPSHPPFVPLPPVGMVMFGTSMQVLISGLPAARSGDIGISPTCCGITPFFEVFTGSSKVFIGGDRAARMFDITMHCKPVPPAGAAKRGLRAALATAMTVAGQVAQASAIAGDVVEAAEADSSAMSAALGMRAGMAAAQMAADAIAIAMGALMGKDPAVPPGSIGAIMLGVPNVLIGGFPMPSWMAVAQGLMKLVKGLKKKKKPSPEGKSSCGCPKSGK
jgi:uncharacterized Zn-binding protein involved in type VI secretion